jgi:hypothetical protein
MLDPYLVPAGGRAVDIKIQPLVPGMRFWAFSSSTSNTTQWVTLTTPQ